MKPSGIHINPAHKGMLHADVGVPADQPIPLSKLMKAKRSRDPKIRRRATFAANARKWDGRNDQ